MAGKNFAAFKNTIEREFMVGRPAGRSSAQRCPGHVQSTALRAGRPLGVDADVAERTRAGRDHVPGTSDAAALQVVQ